MKAAIKAQWLADLRSGNFVQGKDYLDFVDDDGVRKQCCLGVLCHQAVKAGVIPEPVRRFNRFTYEDGDCLNYATLPRAVVEWAGLDWDNPAIAMKAGSSDIRIHAGEANDELDWSFEHIADAIEAYIPET